MNETQLLKAIGLPKATYVGKTLSYNQLESRLTAAQKKVISEQVVARGMRILASIQTNNTNIEVLENETERFDAIVFLTIHVKNIKKAAQVYKVFMSVMTNPLIILFYDDVQTRWIFSTHEKKKDGYLASTQLYEIHEAVTLAQVEQQLHFDELNKSSLKSLYESWLERLLQMELQTRYSVYAPVSLQNNTLEKLVIMDKQIEDYVKQAKKETQLNKRVELQQAANKIKDQKIRLITKMQS
ncbi:MAG: DUF4391 domain-containing protein [Caryophanon sp.]|nr:DUF4391 domain-containing protein [Caryophanon sp.]